MTDYPQQDAANYAGPVATFKTNQGDIKVKLFADIAPKTVENFTTHAKNGYYDNGIFHRVIRDFMIQGGDPEGTGMGGESIWGGSFEDEFSDKLLNVRGALSMANAGPNTNGSQFFIVQADETPWLNGKHTVLVKSSKVWMLLIRLPASLSICMISHVKTLKLKRLKLQTKCLLFLL